MQYGGVTSDELQDALNDRFQGRTGQVNYEINKGHPM